MAVKIKIGKREIITGLILLIILTVYNVLYFVIPFDRSHSNAAFWITYGVTTFLVLFMAVVVFLGISDKEIKSRVFGIPILYMGFSTLIAQFLFDSAVMGIGNFFKIPAWVPIVIEVLVLAFFFVSLIARTAYKDTIQQIDDKNERKEYIAELRVQLKSVMENTNDNDIKKHLEELFELVKYTDPVSTKDVEELEDEISNRFDELKKTINLGDRVKSIYLVQKIKELVNERKERLILSRQ